MIDVIERLKMTDEPFKIIWDCILISKGDIEPKLFKSLKKALGSVAKLRDHKDYNFWILISEKEKEET